ncbi:MAG: hypothetical protein NTZ93_00010 [Candidatus Beckwithbacteria bacterium]|nr:hypothetical protein [Candidatus Beckwithbacteria bacterium]
MKTIKNLKFFTRINYVKKGRSLTGNPQNIPGVKEVHTPGMKSTGKRSDLNVILPNFAPFSPIFVPANQTLVLSNQPKPSISLSWQSYNQIASLTQ